MSSQAPRRVVLVGLGRAAALAMQALISRHDVEIIAAIDPLGGEALAVPPAGIPVYPSLDQLPEADIAIVSTPTPSHPFICEELFDHVVRPTLILCEKPAAVTQERLEKLYVDARRRGIEFRVLLHYGFGSEVLWLAKHLASLGDVASFSAAFADPYSSELAERSRTLVSCWVDSGINALTVLARLVEPKAVVASGADGPESSETQISFTSGRTSGTGVVVTSWLVDTPRKETSLTLVDGSLVSVDHVAGTVTVSGRVVHCPSGREDAARMRYRTMLDAHLNNSSDLFDELATLRLHTLLEEGLTAQRQGQAR